MELNKVFLVGNLTFDPEFRMTGTGKAVAKLRMAVNRRGWGSQQEETLFIDVTVWEKSAEFAKNYLRKGTAVFVEGRLKMDNWQDKDTGANRSKIEVVAERVQFATPRDSENRGQGGGEPGGGGYSKGDGGGREDAPAHGIASPAPAHTEDDLPF